MTTAELERPELYNGDRMTQAEFHRIYKKAPKDFKAELIGGIVYVASPLKLKHGSNHLPLGSLFFAYESATPGVQSADNTTIILGEEGEPQPDLFLRILPEFGGQSRTRRNYVIGAPELLGEIAHSSRSLDLNAKKDEYARHGVLEYLVLCLRERKLRWFDLKGDQELLPGADRVMRVQCFPGLWIHADALVAKNARLMTATLKRGLASPEHAEFVQQLAEKKRRRKRRQS